MAKKKKARWKPLRSGLEREVFEQLEKSGIGFEYEPEKLEYRRIVVRGICNCGSTKVYQRRYYTPDFVLENGIRLEVKGRLTSADRAKLEAIRKQHPDIDLRMLFGANNKITRNKEKRYSDWASDNKIKFCIKQIPESWLQVKS
jgi:Phage endonuclease I.